MIEIRELTKMYGKQYALNHLSLTIPEGQIFGFLGHNGAGKSTTIKCLTSIIEPTSGQVLVDGLNLAEHHSEIKELAMFLILRISFYNYLLKNIGI